MAFAIEGRPDDGGRVPIANIGYVTPDFFDTFAIELAGGRQFDDRDNAATPAVAVVNEAFARFYFPDEVALGRRLLFGDTAIEIAGISRDVQQGGAGFFLTGMQRGPVSTSPTIYVPAAQASAGLFAWFSPVWTVRARSAGDAAAALATAIANVDPLLPLSRVESMEQVVSDAMAQPRLMATLVGALALAALLLSAVGIHGLIAHMVAERTREFGIRLALGATARQTIVAIARSGVVLAGIGAIVGIALSQPAVTVITSFLYTVTPDDPTTYVVVGTLFVVVACLSSVIPALRILRLDPATTLRE
jgi:predicted lysophospholipase L1 biosynthesis ABC-type transport system permease subunit